MSKRLLGIGDVYTYDYKQVHKTRNVGFGYYDPNKVSTTSSTDGYVLVDGVLSVVNEDGSSEPGPGPGPDLPPYTIRLKFQDGTTPTFSKGTGIQVSSLPNIWDLTYENSDWSDLLRNHSNLLEVINANTTGVTNMSIMFAYCDFLTTVPIFDTSNVTDMSYMFDTCESLTLVPLFDTSKVTNMNNMFYNCTNVQYGALALYQQASSQVNPPTNHLNTFWGCGRYTQTGAAELAQIPSDWK